MAKSQKQQVNLLTLTCSFWLVGFPQHIR